MDHKLFKPKDFEEGKHAVVGDCNGFTMQERWDLETPLFAEAIANYQNAEMPRVLDYGCGVGRLSKGLLNSHVQPYQIVGVDASEDMLKQAKEYVDHSKFVTTRPTNLKENYFHLAYCIYVLQHMPAIEIRDALARIHYHLKDDGIFIYCSSDYRMAIRHDEPGFFDDRFLGVDLMNEVKRFFNIEKPLFTQTTIDNHPILKEMIQGSLPHPAWVCSKKKITGQYFNVGGGDEELDKTGSGGVLVEASTRDVQEEGKASLEAKEEKKKILLVNRLAPGDILVMTNALRDLHKEYPGRFVTDVRTPCPAIWDNNPYITKLDYNEDELQKIVYRFSKLDGIKDPSQHTAQLGDIFVIDMHYPSIHTSGLTGAHFSEGHTGWLEQILDIKIPVTDLRPDIYLTEDEKNWVSPYTVHTGLKTPYWVLNAGIKDDYTLKQYPYFQDVVSGLKWKWSETPVNEQYQTPEFDIVQVGLKEHGHTPLSGVIDMVGHTDNMRDLFRLIYHAQGVITCVSLSMHIAAALNKPCVVVAGAREGTRWELYPNHQFLYVNGCLPCATYDGCWKSKTGDCNNKVRRELGATYDVSLNKIAEKSHDNIPKCMTLIKPLDVIRSIDRYYEGGMILDERLVAL